MSNFVDCTIHNKFRVKSMPAYLKGLQSQFTWNSYLEAKSADGYTFIAHGIRSKTPGGAFEVEAQRFLDFLFPHLRAESKVRLTLTRTDEHTLPIFAYVTPEGWSLRTHSDIFLELQKNHYPRKVKSKVSKFDFSNQLWIDVDSVYIAKKLVQDNGKEYLHIDHGNNVVIPWEKESFYEYEPEPTSGS